MLDIRKAEASELVGHEKQTNRGVKQHVNLIHSGDKGGK